MFQFNVIDEISDKQIELVSLGKSGFVLAVGMLQEQDHLQNTIKIVQKKQMAPHDV